MDPKRTEMLLEALQEGKLLKKVHYNDESCVETMGYDSGAFFIGGWASALGRTEDRVLELIMNPELWQIEV